MLLQKGAHNARGTERHHRQGHEISDDAPKCCNLRRTEAKLDKRVNVSVQAQPHCGYVVSCVCIANAERLSSLKKENTAKKPPMKLRIPLSQPPLSRPDLRQRLRRQLLLIRLFQHATSSSVGRCRGRHSLRLCGNFSQNLLLKRLAKSIWQPAAGRRGLSVRVVGIGEPMNWCS